jgi:opacity protein-like surface antigen
MAGASVDLTQNLKLDAGYRYRHINGGKMFEGGQYLGDGYDKGMDIHDVRVGLRYMFGGSSAPYAPQQVSTIVDGPVYK